ncbi:hypothetical protein FCL47_07525 [Desulfopila sp. IMCC35006]|nr:hypothetical protein FCL47_07525 [Desulfopila sp. IMCC35006]
MQCERLIKMIKSWYLHVREETMAPARMISFIEKHAASCDICQSDPDLKEEIIKITELVLPESKIPKAVRQKSSLDDDEGEDLDDDDVESDDDTDVDDTDDSDESDEDIDADDDDDLDLDDELSDEEDEI